MGCVPFSGHRPVTRQFVPTTASTTVALQLNVRVPQRVPAEKRAHVLAFQVVAVVRAMDVYKTLWFGDEAARERVPRRGPDGHAKLPTSLL